MENLSKEQKDEMATSMAALALYDGGAEVTSDQINALLEATGNEVEGFYPIIFAQFLSPEKIAGLISSPGGSGGGGGGGAGGGDEGGDVAEEEKEEEKEEEEEMDLGGGMDMFGGDDAGDGDY